MGQNVPLKSKKKNIVIALNKPPREALKDFSNLFIQYFL